MQQISESSLTSLLMVTTACVTKLSALSAETREQHSRGLASPPQSDNIRLTKIEICRESHSSFQNCFLFCRIKVRVAQIQVKITQKLMHNSITLSTHEESIKKERNRTFWYLKNSLCLWKDCPVL